MIITENAHKEISKLLVEMEMPFFRISVQGGGCSGFKYHFDFDEVKNEDDFELDPHIVIDALSMQYLGEAEIDYVEDLVGSYFNIKNPTAQTTCGCGSSFSF